MKETYRILTLFIFLIGTSYKLEAQDIFDKLSKKLCNCIEKEEVKTPDEMKPCFENLFLNNITDIKKYYKSKTIDDLNMEEISNKIGTKLIKTCPYLIDNFPSGIVGNEKKVTKQSDLGCNDLKNGNFYYLSETSDSRTVDTTFVTISNHMFLERMKNGRTYSLLDINWKDNCAFNLIFKESNDPMKRELSKPGDVYEYEILTNGNKSVFLKTVWMNTSYQFELIKMN